MILLRINFIVCHVFRDNMPSYVLTDSPLFDMRRRACIARVPRGCQHNTRARMCVL